LQSKGAVREKKAGKKVNVELRVTGKEGFVACSPGRLSHQRPVKKAKRSVLTGWKG